MIPWRAGPHLVWDATVVVGILGSPQQTKESARSADKRPPPGYCMAICFYCEALGHMFLLVGCGRGARPYVSIGWLWAWGSAIWFYYVPLGHMFVLVGCGRGARPYVSIVCVCVYVYVCVCICVCVCGY